VERIRTGFAPVDYFLREGSGYGGLVCPSFVLLGAEPKIGKSTFAQQLCEQHVELDPGNVAYYADFENGLNRWYRRLVKRRARLTGGELEAGLGEEAEARMKEAAAWLREGPGKRYYYNGDRHLSAAKLRAELQGIRKEHPAAKLLVVLDSLQKMPMDLMNRRAEIDEWLRTLEEYRTLFHCVVFAVSELKRPTFGSGKSYKATGLAFKESGDAEYTADLALLMFRPDARMRKVVLTAPWNRDGPAGDVCELIPSADLSRFTAREAPKKGEGDEEM
jgi:replicative DNA helicase